MLDHQKMAFTKARAESAKALLSPGDTLYVYTSRSCFHNPTRDRGRVIGEATVRSKVTRRSRSVIIGNREYTDDCSIAFRRLAPFRTGVELAPIVESLDAFRDGQWWPFKLRRTLLALSNRDAARLKAALKRVTWEDTVRARLTYTNRG